MIIIPFWAKMFVPRWKLAYVIGAFSRAGTRNDVGAVTWTLVLNCIKAFIFL